MSVNVMSIEQGYSNPRIKIIGGAMVEQPQQADDWLFNYFTAMKQASLFRLMGKMPHAAEDVYGALLEQFPQAELVIPPNYGVMGGAESTFQYVNDRLAATEDDPVFLVGHSFGGVLARRKMAMDPETVAGALIIDSPSTEEGIDSFPYNLPLQRAYSVRVLRPHFRAIRKGREPANIVTLGSTESCISPENSLDLSDTVSNIRRILFRPKERGSYDDIYDVEVEERVAAGDLSHVSLPSNPSVIAACGEILTLAA